MTAVNVFEDQLGKARDVNHLFLNGSVPEYLTIRVNVLLIPILYFSPTYYIHDMHNLRYNMLFFLLHLANLNGPD